MAYQPISHSNAGMSRQRMVDFGKSMSDLANWRRQREMDAQAQQESADQKKRQGVMDFQNAYNIAQGYLEKGDKAGFEATMAPYLTGKVDLDAEQSQLIKEMGLERQAPMTQPEAQPAQGGSAVPDQLDEGRKMVGDMLGDTAEPLPDDIEYMDQLTRKQTPDVGQLMQQAAPQQAPQAPAQQDQLNPILASYGKQKEQDAQRAARLKYMLRSPTGQTIEVDPEARRNFALQREEQDAARVMQQFGGIEAIAPEDRDAFRAVLQMTRDPMKAYGEVEKRRMGREKMAQDQADAQAKRDEFDRQEGIRQGNRLAAQGNAARLGIGKGMNQAQGDTSARGWHSQAETKLQRYLTSQGYTKEVTALRSYDEQLEKLESGMTALQTAGLGAWVKEASGGSAVITEAEIKRYLKQAMPPTADFERAFHYWATNDPRLPREYVQPFIDGLKGYIIQKKRDTIHKIGLGAKLTLSSDPNPEIKSLADSAYTQATSPLLSKEELEQEIERQNDSSKGRGAKRSAKGASITDIVDDAMGGR